jgi:hypothetical protein
MFMNPCRSTRLRSAVTLNPEVQKG